MKYGIELIIEGKTCTFEADFESNSQVVIAFYNSVVSMRKMMSTGLLMNGACVLGTVLGVVAAAQAEAPILIAYGVSIPSLNGIVWDVTADKIWLRRDAKLTVCTPLAFEALLKRAMLEEKARLEEQLNVSRETAAPPAPVAS